jgi:hypothetical protein
VTRETLTADELAAAEYFDADGGADGIASAILHALDHRDEVLARQRAMLTRLAARTWADVAADMLGLVPRSEISQSLAGLEAGW